MLERKQEPRTSLQKLVCEFVEKEILRTESRWGRANSVGSYSPEAKRLRQYYDNEFALSPTPDSRAWMCMSAQSSAGLSGNAGAPAAAVIVREDGSESRYVLPTRDCEKLSLEEPALFWAYGYCQALNEMEAKGEENENRQKAGAR